MTDNADNKAEGNKMYLKNKILKHIEKSSKCSLVCCEENDKGHIEISIRLNN